MQINLFKATLSLRAGARLGCGLLRKLNRWNKRKRESRKSRHQETPPALHPLMNHFSREKIKGKQSIPFRQFQKYFKKFFFHTNKFFLLSQSEMLYSNFLLNWWWAVERTAPGSLLSSGVNISSKNFKNNGRFEQGENWNNLNRPI